MDAFKNTARSIAANLDWDDSHDEISIEQRLKSAVGSDDPNALDAVQRVQLDEYRARSFDLFLQVNRLRLAFLQGICLAKGETPVSQAGQQRDET